MPAASQLHRQVVRKDCPSRDLNVNPLVHLHYIELVEPGLDRSGGELERLLQALAEQWRLANLSCAPHLLLGISPVQLGTAPFTLASDGPTTLGADELDLAVNPGARAYVLPCIAGHVGADTAGMLLAEEPWKDAAVAMALPHAVDPFPQLSQQVALPKSAAPAAATGRRRSANRPRRG